jgi:hypothetical protein
MAVGEYTIVDLNDGTGISSTQIQYGISDSATDPPGNVMTDENDNPITDENGKPMTDGTWYDEVPEVPVGFYLWTRTLLLLNDGTFYIMYSVSGNGKDGEAGEKGADGRDGEDGAHMVLQIEQFYVCDSNETIPHNAKWCDTEPAEGESGKWRLTYPDGSTLDGEYIWGRWKIVMSDGSIMYTNPVYHSTIDQIYFKVNQAENKIESKISKDDFETELTESGTIRTIQN